MSLLNSAATIATAYAELVETKAEFPPGFPFKPDGRIDSANQLAADYFTDDRTAEFAFRLRASVEVSPLVTATDLGDELKRVKVDGGSVQGAVEAFGRLQARFKLLVARRAEAPAQLDETLVALTRSERGAALLLASLHCWLTCKAASEVVSTNVSLERWRPLDGASVALIQRTLARGDSALSDVSGAINVLPPAEIRVLIDGPQGGVAALATAPQHLVAFLWDTLADTSGPDSFADANELFERLHTFPRDAIVDAIAFADEAALRDEIYYSIALSGDEPLLAIETDADDNPFVSAGPLGFANIDSVMSDWDALIDGDDFRRWLPHQLEVGPASPLGTTGCRKNAKEWLERNNRNRLEKPTRQPELAGELD